MKSQLIVAVTLLLATCDLALGCDQADPADIADAEVEAALDREADLDDLVAKAGLHPKMGGNPGGKALSKHRAAGHAAVVMPDAEAAFEEVVALVQEHYVEGPLGEDQMWSAATEGVLSRLLQLQDHPVNALLSPEELVELEAGTRGAIVGVGVAIELVSDVVVVREIIPGSPAERAELQAGDRILGVDGERLRGLGLPAVVGKIRGEAGSEIDLFVQRDTEEWNEVIERGTVQFDSVTAQMLEGGVGLLEIRSFAKNTALEARAHLEALQKEGMTALVLDLRECPGGLLDTSVETASLLLPDGAEIVMMESRDKETETRTASGASPWQSLPVVALVGRHTASGAEILAEALMANDRGTVLGEQTVGKGTAESIHVLENGWALKLSVSKFHAPGSTRKTGEGVVPDIVVPDARAEGSERDVQLDAAIKLLATR